ncbi:MAG TPA: HD domain-containing protein [Symbiobacteriaceae bacterium]|nr:HD domain-containing protein [Symbiobacteriaceae bacterium]
MLLRDPVHGDIFLTDMETRVLDTREMQRLRNIKQLGAAHLVFPGCVHTRFDHSLGALASAHRIMENLRLVGFHIDPQDAALVRLAILTHDVTHIPYGHTFEDERQIFPRHDAGPRLDYFFGPGCELGRVLAELGVLETVRGILTGAPPTPWMGQVVSSTVDADLLDYLRRDSFFAGLRQDYDDRIYSYFTLEGGQLLINMVKHGIDRPDARTEILHLLRMRYMLTERIYLHHAKIAAGAMISKAVELHAQRGLREEALYDLGDQTFVDLLARLPGPAVAAQLVEGLATRHLYKRAYVLSEVSLAGSLREFIAKYGGQSAEREALENEIAAKVKLKPGQVIFYCPKASFFKEVRVPVKARAGIGPLYKLDTNAGEVGALARQYESLWRAYVFCPPEKVDAVRRACEKMFALPSEFAD